MGNREIGSTDAPVALPKRLGEWRQWTAGIIASLGMWVLGSALGWSAPTAPQLEEGKGINALTKSEISWVASLVMLAVLPGTFLGGYLVDKLGRKGTLIAAVPPTLIGWGIVASAQNAWMLIIGRIIIGVACGSFPVSAVVYFTEFTEDKLRSKLASWTVVSLCLGILYTFIIGALVSWRVNTIISGATALLILVGMLFLPESPRYLVTVGQHSKAAAALQWFRGVSTKEDVDNELDKLIADVAEANPNDNPGRNTSEKLLVGSTVKPVLICISAAVFCQLSGTSAVTFYTVNIFEDAGSDIQPNVATILVGATQAVATAFAGVLMTRFGRRPLFIFSEWGMCLSLAVLGGFYFLKEQNPAAANNLGWLPLANLLSFTIAYCCGAGILPWALMADLCPPHVKGLTSAICTAVNCGLGFVVALVFPSLLDWIQGYGAFWLFASINAVGAIFMTLVLPETKDKTMDEILDMFREKTKRTTLRV